MQARERGHLPLSVTTLATLCTSHAAVGPRKPSLPTQQRPRGLVLTYLSIIARSQDPLTLILLLPNVNSILLLNTKSPGFWWGWR